MVLAVLVLLAVAFQPISRAEDSAIFTEWKFMPFDIPNISGAEGTFTRALPLDFDQDHRRRTFITTPMFTSDTPFSLSTYDNGPEPTLHAYPDFSYHSNRTNCSSIISVFRVAIDECNRMFAIDSGFVQNKTICPPKLLVFNLKNDQLIRTYEFPDDQAGDNSLMVTPVVDVRSRHRRCENTMVYIGDTQEYALLVYNYAKNKSWRIRNEAFQPEPGFENFPIAGDSFELNDGIAGLSLSPKSRYILDLFTMERERYLYFHSISGSMEYRIGLSLLNNESFWILNSNRTDIFQTLGSRGTQSSAEVMDSMGNIYFGLMTDIAIAAWNTNTPYNRENFEIVDQNYEALQFIGGVKVKKMEGREFLWAVSNRYQRYAANTFNYSDVNFRVLRYDLTKNYRNDHFFSP